MKQPLIVALAALLVAHPLLLQAQNTGTLSVELENDDAIIQVEHETAEGNLELELPPGRAYILLGGGAYPLIRIPVPVRKAQTTRVRGRLVEARNFARLLRLEELDAKALPEDYYAEASLRDEEAEELMSVGETFSIKLGAALVAPILLPLLVLGAYCEEEFPDQSQSDDTLVGAMFWVGCVLGAGFLIYGLAGLIAGKRDTKTVKLRDNIEHNQYIISVATEQADTANLDRLQSENIRRRKMRRDALSALFVEYCVGEGDWIDVTPDLSDYNTQP